jgi:hypothetical protein
MATKMRGPIWVIAVLAATSLLLVGGVTWLYRRNQHPLASQAQAIEAIIAASVDNEKRQLDFDPIVVRQRNAKTLDPSAHRIRVDFADLHVTVADSLLSLRFDGKTRSGGERIRLVMSPLGAGGDREFEFQSSRGERAAVAEQTGVAYCTVLQHPIALPDGVDRVQAQWTAANAPVGLSCGIRTTNYGLTASVSGKPDTDDPMQDSQAVATALAASGTEAREADALATSALKRLRALTDEARFRRVLGISAKEIRGCDREINDLAELTYLAISRTLINLGRGPATSLVGLPGGVAAYIFPRGRQNHIYVFDAAGNYLWDGQITFGDNDTDLSEDRVVRTACELLGNGGALVH